MIEAFHDGGWGMFPTALMGIALVVTAVRYANRPQRRRLPQILSLGVLTTLMGCLGFISGCIRTLYVATSGEWPGPAHEIAMAGFGESLNNIGLTLALLALAAAATTIGIWRTAMPLETGLPSLDRDS